MKKSRTILVGFLAVVVLMTGGFSLNSVAQDSSESEIPEIFQLNPSLNFDKEATRQWAEENSWKEANKLTQKAHVRSIENSATEYTSARFYPPLMTWVEQNYKGAQRFWDKSKIIAEYIMRLDRPSESAYFMVGIGRTNRSGVKKENWRFVLEVKDKHWEASQVGTREVETRQFLGTTAYVRIFDVRFDFTGMEGHPEWSKWTLYLIRKDIMSRKKLTWEFDEKYL